MGKLYLFTFFTFFSILFNTIYAQPQKGEFININVGIGISAPYDEATNLTGSGFYAQAEYVWSPYSWFGIRPYAGVIAASGKSNEQGVQESVKSNAALLGIKARLVAPIPYVAPFVESGVGMSIGSFETYTQFTNLKKSGVLLHIPLSIGLAIGRKHNIEIKYTYYYHDAVKQFSGAAAIGYTFPIN